MGYWIDTYWELRTILLDLKPLTGYHSGYNMCNALVEVIDGFDMLSRIHAIVADNARNNDTMLVELERICHDRDILFNKHQNRVRCICHIINLAVQAMLAELGAEPSNTESSDVGESTMENNCVKKLRRLFASISRSAPRRRELDRQCLAHNMEQLAPVLDIPTRWNSSYAMIKRGIKLREPLSVIANRIDTSLNALIPTDTEWELLEKIRNILEVFDLVSTKMSGEHYLTLHQAVPAYNYLWDKLEDFSTEYSNTPIISNAINAAIGKLGPYYGLTDSEVYPISTILDPSTKLSYYKDNGWEDEFVEQAKNAITRVFNERYQLVPPSPANGESAGHNNDINRMFKRRRAETRSELDKYLEMPAEDDIVILQWWKAKERASPQIAAMARDYLAIPASSASIERAFSSVGHLVSSERGSLSAETIRTCACLKNWITHAEKR